jgi:hypothetical protein
MTNTDAKSMREAGSEKPYYWHWRIMQDVGDERMAVASGFCLDRSTMLREMSHYAALYVEDGPIELQTRAGKNRWRRHNP